MNNLYEAALDYQRQKLPIFPCQIRGKEPACARGCLDATNDLARIQSWWGQISDLNIGLATGRAAGLFVVDVDDDTGRRSLDELESKHGKLPPTISALTGRGEHLYFRLNGHSVRNIALLPPSLHPSGRAYAWNVDSAPDFAAAPDWLYDLLGTRPCNGGNGNGYKQTLEFWDGFFGQDRPEGERHSALIKVAGKFHHAGLRDPFMLFHALNFYNGAHMRPVLPPADILAAVEYVVRSALKESASGREI